MARQDLNALTISGHVHSEPELHQFDDGDKAYTFVLAHTTDHHHSGHWELQFYTVSIWAPFGKPFIDTVQIGQRIVVTGRLDSVYHETFTGYQPIVSIIAERVITTNAPAQDTSTTEPLFA